VSWNTSGNTGEQRRFRGQNLKVNLNQPPLATFIPLSGYGESHGYLTNEFINTILEDRKPLVDIAMALNLTFSGIVAHHSAEKEGELMKIQQYSF